MILEANTDVLTSLRKFYQNLLRSKDFGLKTACKGDIVAFADEVDVMIYDSRMHIARAKVLVRITADRKSLVLEHLQSQATEKQSRATEEMERLTQSMHKLGMNAQKEAIAVRIITVVTLIFLPATFVSVSYSIYFS
jgi:Mg2+ and Co2+ transporter CorA